LPAGLIAQQPAKSRSRSRLLVLRRGTAELTETVFCRIGDMLAAGDCLVLNNTKVLPAKFQARKSTGGKLQGLFLAEKAPHLWEVMLRGAGKIQPGQKIRLLEKTGKSYCCAELLWKNGQTNYLLKIERAGKAEKILNKVGFAPLPPYIKRAGSPDIDRGDKRRYQTVYAAVLGAVAAPTAGLHFTRQLINRLKSRGVIFANITLHVNLGTFKPVVSDNLEDHEMHSERFIVNSENARIINTARSAGRRIIAVGTTTVRALETAAEGSTVRPADTTTELFITPGYKFKIADAMLTNFHLPGSTPLAMVAAFAGLENIRNAYRHAIKQKYRFYSYGDAMLII